LKSLFVTFAILCVVSAHSTSLQGPPMPKPPAELRKIGWLKGSWDADLKMFEGGKQVGTAKGPVNTTDSLGNMFLETRFESNMGGMAMKGLQMTSYDPAKKQYVAFWFDNMGPGGLELWGSLKGQTLVLTSKPVAVPGMPGKMAFRSTNAMKGANTMMFRLEMNSGKGWGKMLEGTLTRK